jgi:hypothetical protein
MTRAKKVLVVVAVQTLLTLGAWVAVQINTVRVHTNWSEQVSESLRVLHRNRPAEVPADRWEHLCSWTMNRHANCGGIESAVEEWREPFAAQLRRRVSGPVGVADIDWIWDEYAAHTTHGPRYSRDYRPTRPE